MKNESAGMRQCPISCRQPRATARRLMTAKRTLPRETISGKESLKRESGFAISSPPHKTPEPEQRKYAGNENGVAAKDGETVRQENGIERLEETDVMATHWVIDWKRINSIEDIKALLRACELQPQPSHPSFELLKPFCKQIDDDGREVPQAEATSAS